MYKVKNTTVEAKEYTGDNLNELIKFVGEIFKVYPSKVKNIDDVVYAVKGKDKVQLKQGDVVVRTKTKWLVMNKEIFEEFYERTDNEY